MFWDGGDCSGATLPPGQLPKVKLGSSTFKPFAPNMSLKAEPWGTYGKEGFLFYKLSHLQKFLEGNKSQFPILIKILP